MTSSRTLQNIQHCICGLKVILFISIGIFFGKSEWAFSSLIIIVVIAFVIARILNEYFYRILLKKMREEKKEKKFKIHNWKLE